MRRGLKVLLWLVPALVLAPFVAFAAYDVVVFQPRMSGIRSLVAAASPEEKSPPDSVRRVLRVSYSNDFTGHVAYSFADSSTVSPD